MPNKFRILWFFGGNDRTTAIAMVDNMNQLWVKQKFIVMKSST